MLFWLIIKKKMEVRTQLSELERQLEDASALALIHTELPHWPDSGPSESFQQRKGGCLCLK